MKKNKISKSWVIRQRRDKYVRQSKLEGYRSRAVYKLKELDEKFKIVKNNLSIFSQTAMEYHHLDITPTKINLKIT